MLKRDESMESYIYWSLGKGFMVGKIIKIQISYKYDIFELLSFLFIRIYTNSLGLVCIVSPINPEQKHSKHSFFHFTIKISIN